MKNKSEEEAITESKVKRPRSRWLKYKEGDIQIYEGDCFKMFKDIENNSVSLVVTSPPYCIGKEYEDQNDDLQSFKRTNRHALKESIRILKPGGSLCWQVGYHVSNAQILPLDIVIYNLIEDINKKLPKDEKMVLHNRIIWTFGHGFNDAHRFCGRHETILWFTKGNRYTFNLDPVRIPQKYPGKTYSSGPKKGMFSGNPLGKNPSDVWNIPNVKSKHIEKTDHPCQFPISLVQRLVLALTNEDDIVVDPFLGSGTSAAVCALQRRKFIGAEKEHEYIMISNARVQEALDGTLKYREDKPVIEPDPNSAVARKPDYFQW